MSKAADMAKVSAKGGFHLLWGLVISTVISSVGTIFIARWLGSDLYGLYGIALTAPGLIGVFRDWGVNSAMVRSTAQYCAENKAHQVRTVFISGLTFELITGLILSVITIAISGFLAGTVFNRPEVTGLIQIASISILATGIINAATAAFVGTEKMHLNGFMLIIQSIIKTLLMIALVAAGLGTSGAIIGYTLGFITASIIGAILMWTIYRKLPKPDTTKLGIKECTKSMLTYGAPLSIAAIIGGFQTQFYAFLLPIFYTTDNILIGNYGIASTFVVLITFFATPITTILFPAFSKLDAKKDQETLKNVFQASVKYASLLVVPVSTLVMSLAEPAVSTLFGATYNAAPLFLALLAVTYVYTIFGNLSTGNLINSQGQTSYNLKLTIITAIIGFPMGAILILKFGVLGLIATTLTAGLTSMFLSLRFVKKQYGVSVDWRSSTKVLFSSILTAVLTYGLVSFLTFSSWIRLVIGVVFFVVVFILAAMATRAVTRADLAILREMVSGLGPLKGILNNIISAIEKIMLTLKL